MNLRNHSYAQDFQSIDPECPCPCCRPDGWKITRALIHSLACRETTGAHFLTIHNVAYQLNLMKQARTAIINGNFVQFVKNFFRTLYKERNYAYPEWVIESLKLANIDLAD